MKKLYLYNTLSRKKEEFIPIKETVGLYTCGPTVYDFAHLGNLRAYIFEDILKRTLIYNGYKVKHVMNITDVGHLTGDGDMGEDKMEKGARREGKSAWEIAEFFTDEFKKDIKSLNIINSDNFCRVTDHIQEQIDLIKTLEQKGYTYQISDGIYFDTSKVSDYNKLSHLKLEELEEGARVEINEEKKHPTDFALWKFSPKDVKRQMEWDSPWGIGFPGWHIECSAISLKYLGDKIDIHCGGADHVNIHHTNELAQTEAATGKKPWVNYWLHNAFLNIAGGKKMAKSAGNFLTLNSAVIEKGLSPLAYRYGALQTHYRKPMEYSEEALVAAQSGLEHLYNQVRNLGTAIGEVNQEYKDKFLEVINDDLNTAQALAVAQELLKSDLNNADKLATILDFDKILGLKLGEVNNEEIPEDIQALVNQRIEARNNKNWELADSLRIQIEEKGYLAEDNKDGMRIYRK
jgi:cysteinyl-tRNA synthetase